jgi:hypothetical protein
MLMIDMSPLFPSFYFSTFVFRFCYEPLKALEPVSRNHGTALYRCHITFWRWNHHRTEPQFADAVDKQFIQLVVLIPVNYESFDADTVLSCVLAALSGQHGHGIHECNDFIQDAAHPSMDPLLEISVWQNDRWVLSSQLKSDGSQMRSSILGNLILLSPIPTRTRQNSRYDQHAQIQ